MKGLNIEYACDIYTVAYIKALFQVFKLFSYANIKLLFNTHTPTNSYKHTQNIKSLMQM